MAQLLQLLVSGLSLGAVYALLALGFVVVYKASGVVNFAHPALLMVGAYVTARLSAAGGVPFLVAVVAGIGGAAIVSLVVQFLLVGPVARRSVVAASILTIGVDILPMGDPWQNGVVTVAGLTIPQSRIVALVVGLMIITAFFGWFKFSTWGIAMRAVAEDPETAALMGVRRSRVSALAWGLAGLLAAVAGLFITVFPSPGLEPVTATVALRAFPAAIIGGLDSTSGAVVGGLVVGVAEVMTQGYASELSFLGLGFHTVMPYVVMVLVLMARPSGLFGTRELHRV